MANIKNVTITGAMPFNAIDDSTELQFIVAKLNAPYSGLTLGWILKTDTPAPNFTASGKACPMVKFVIYGKDSVSDKFVTRIVKAFQDADGIIGAAIIADIENGGTIRMI